MSRIERLEIRVMHLPLREPFEISLGVQTRVENVLVALFLEDETVGLGEASPSALITGESTYTAVEAIKSVRELIVGRSIHSMRDVAADVSRLLLGQRSARAAIEVALLDAYCKHLGVSIHEYFGRERRPVETDLTVPIVPPAKAGLIAKEAAEQGFRIFKVKVGKELSTDLARVTAVKNAVPDGRLRLDANQGFCARDAVRLAEAIRVEGIEVEIFEQPVSRNDIEGMRFVRNHVGIPVYADESVLEPTDAARIARENAADGINIKVMKSAVFDTLDIISIARACGLKLMIGCMGESSIGNCFSVQLACSFEAITHADLDGPFFYERDFLETAGPQIEPTGKSGIGIQYEQIDGSELLSEQKY